ncbi:hypothetical protein L596_021136 [Steinernema carpocapsae]|uniref:Uncharacterized protein n=1 Tax=Steinernema carpocapsae TaxID=34508 RepID=A0A4U5MVU9_STECR|nr:hypothetical protein L596_021136 [Steinernema carpocapsae]
MAPLWCVLPFYASVFGFGRMRFPRQPHASFESDACGKTAEDAGRMRLELWGDLKVLIFCSSYSAQAFKLTAKSRFNSKLSRKSIFRVAIANEIVLILSVFKILATLRVAQTPHSACGRFPL